MPQPTIWRRVMTLSAISVCTAFALSASAGGRRAEYADSKTGAATFAVVDFKKLSAKYTARETVEADINAMKAKFNGRLKRRDEMPFLSEEEQKQLDDLYEKAPAAKTDADNNKIKEIETKNRVKSEHIQTLRTKADKDLTEADKTELKDANEIVKNATVTFTKMNDALNAQMNEFGNAKTDELIARLRACIAKVSEQKGFSAVFNNEVAPYAGVDITDQVISELNKKGAVKAPENKAGSTFAIVDFKKVTNGYKAKDAIEAELKAMQTKFDARLLRRDQNPFLSEEDQKALDDIDEKPNKTEADNNKFKEILAKNKAKTDEVQTIRAKADKDLTDGDKAKLKAADETFRTAQLQFGKLKESLTNQITEYGNTKSDELMVKIRAAISSVAAKAAVAIVFNSEVALYAGADITDQVIAELNKK